MSHTGIFVIAYTLSVGRLLYCACPAEPSHTIHYTRLDSAQKFFSRQQAETFLTTALPAISRIYHAVVEVSEHELLLYCPSLYAKQHA